ncbi:MAG: hypothetical protein HC930_03730 [Hydrococcus sp. SU_1_0]|nr:hypothetical protein [Hydrococcus sp. SU_1_0]
MEAEELKFLLVHVQSQLDEATANKQRLILMRDRVQRANATRSHMRSGTRSLSEGVPFRESFRTCTYRIECIL